MTDQPILTNDDNEAARFEYGDDPLAEALSRADPSPDWRPTYRTSYYRRYAAAIRAALDAAGYEVRPKLTAERLADALAATYLTIIAEKSMPNPADAILVTARNIARAALSPEPKP